MKMKISLVLLCFSWMFLSRETNAQKVIKRPVKYDFLLYLPKKYVATQEAFPLVIYLHGGSQRGQDLNKLKIYGLPYLVDKGREFDFIIASPQCPDGKYWSTDNWFDSLYTTLKNTYRIDTKRVYLTGISMGGYGTWQTALDHPDTFAAIMPLCGGCDDSTQICRIKYLPVRTFHGTTDDVIPITETERLVKRLEVCGSPVQFIRLANKGHGIQYVYEDPALYEWLLKQHR